MCFCARLFVSQPYGKITQNVMDGLKLHFKEMSLIGPGTTDYILGLNRD